MSILIITAEFNDSRFSCRHLTLIDVSVYIAVMDFPSTQRKWRGKNAFLLSKGTRSNIYCNSIELWDRNFRPVQTHQEMIAAVFSRRRRVLFYYFIFTNELEKDFS